MEPPRHPIGEYVEETEPSPARRAQWIDVLEAAPRRLRRATAGLSDTQLDAKYRNWTIRQIVHHLADSHMQSYARFKWALTENRPTIKPYDETAMVRAGGFDHRRRRGVARPDRRTARRAGSCSCEASSTTTSRRTFHHPETGRSPRLDEVLGYYAWHARHHTGQIVWLRNVTNSPNRTEFADRNDSRPIPLAGPA